MKIHDSWNVMCCRVTNIQHFDIYFACVAVKKVKQSVTGLEWPEGSRKLRFPDFMTTAQDSGMVVNITHRPPLPPGNTPGTHFC
jgi:hypothetical protein